METKKKESSFEAALARCNRLQLVSWCYRISHAISSENHAVFMPLHCWSTFALEFSTLTCTIFIGIGLEGYFIFWVYWYEKAYRKCCHSLKIFVIFHSEILYLFQPVCAGKGWKNTLEKHCIYISKYHHQTYHEIYQFCSSGNVK